MNIKIKYENCGAELQVEAQLSPTTFECPICKEEIGAPAMSIGKGTIIGGFQVERTIGKGAMGTVYLAKQLSMDRMVALKILPQMVTVDKEMVQRFINEVHMLARVDHPNIVTAFEAGEHEGVYYLAMTYVDGEDLGTRIKREGKIPEKEALQIMRKAAVALAYAWNEHKILHNDMKPDNILIDHKGEVRIMDLGLAKDTFESTGLTMSGVAFGTPNYMSPEQATGARDLDFRSDQYAVGASLYRLITGALPHSGTSVIEVLTKKNTEPIPSPRRINPEITEGCEHLLTVLMAKERQLRYDTWEEVITDIDHVINGELPQAAMPGEGESTIIPLATSRHKQADLAETMADSDQTPLVSDKNGRGEAPLKKINRGLLGATLVLLAVIVVGIGYIALVRPRGQDSTGSKIISEHSRPVSHQGWQDEFKGLQGSPAPNFWSLTGRVELENDKLKLNAMDYAWGASGVMGNVRPLLAVDPPAGI